MHNEFSMDEKIKLILYYYYYNRVNRPDNIEKFPEIRKFIDMGYYNLDERTKSIYKINEKGKAVLEEFLREAAKIFIEYMEEHEGNRGKAEILDWLRDEYNVIDEEICEIFCLFICLHIKNCGYRVHKGYSLKKGELVLIRKEDAFDDSDFVFDGTVTFGRG